ncbi:MAG: hypothetical protein LQ338_005250 [Usnochroma carphineum]|nr:MAG: hypothetical protein LQ338_005250 [Usnochroma carphineum]
MDPKAGSFSPMPVPLGGGDSAGLDILVVTWVFTGITTVVVCLKIWTRFKIIQQTGLDDILTVIALGFLLAYAPMITVSVHRGLGQHVYYLTPEARTGAIKLALITNPLIYLAASWPNISVAISLNRILVPLPWQVWIFAAIATIIRTVYINDPGLTLDFPYTIHKILIWAVIESAFIVIAACIPSLRPFVRVLGQSLDFGKAKTFLIPKGYHHSHSRRNRPRALVPRESGCGTPATPSPRDGYERDGDLESGFAQFEKRQASAGITPPATDTPEKSMQQEAEEATSHV